MAITIRSNGQILYPFLSAGAFYTHVLNRGPAGVRSPADRMFLS
jgi:hypothetical protein